LETPQSLLLQQQGLFFYVWIGKNIQLKEKRALIVQSALINVS
jgi:hypothetical protein